MWLPPSRGGLAHVKEGEKVATGHDVDTLEVMKMEAGSATSALRDPGGKYWALFRNYSVYSQVSDAIHGQPADDLTWGNDGSCYSLETPDRA